MPSASSVCASCVATRATSRAAARTRLARRRSFRNRAVSPLGDVINSSPYFVGAPNFGYYDDFEAARYSTFVATYRARTPVIYMGANDGMLHAINATNGVEMFAYVPSPVYGDLSKLTDLAYQHRYYVDGSPTVGDVFYAAPGTRCWSRACARAPRACSRSTSPIRRSSAKPTRRASSAGSSRTRTWATCSASRFSSRPTTAAGRWWSAAATTRATRAGTRFLFIIDAETGALVAKIDTGSGTAASPDGLSAAAAIDINGDGVADMAYAGDLDGNLWKFDLFSTLPGSWSLSNGGLPLFAAGSGHAITGRPDVTKFTVGGYLVAFGTGRYIATSDNTDLTTQRVYAVRDTGTAGTVALSSLVHQTILGTATGPDGNLYRFSTHAVGVPSDYTVTGDNTVVPRHLSERQPRLVPRPPGFRRARGRRRALSRRARDLHLGRARRQHAVRVRRLGLGARVRRHHRQPVRQRHLRQQRRQHAGIADFISRTGLASQAQNTSGRRIGAIPAAPGFMSNRAGGVTGLEDKFINTSDGSVVRVRETSGAGREGRVMWHEVR